MSGRRNSETEGESGGKRKTELRSSCRYLINWVGTTTFPPLLHCGDESVIRKTRVCVIEIRFLDHHHHDNIRYVHSYARYHHRKLDNLHSTSQQPFYHLHFHPADADLQFQMQVSILRQTALTTCLLLIHTQRATGKKLQIQKTNRPKTHNLECVPMSNVMAAQPNIGCALCWTPQSLADAHC